MCQLTNFEIATEVERIKLALDEYAILLGSSNKEDRGIIIMMLADRLDKLVQDIMN